MKREASFGVLAAGIALVAMLTLPILAPTMEQATARQEADAVRLQAASERSGLMKDGIAGDENVPLV